MIENALNITMKYHTAQESRKIMSFAANWMELVKQSKSKQRQILCDLPYLWYIE